MAGGVRFVHTADLHLGRPFAGLASSDIARDLIDAVPRSFARVIDTAIERQVDFVVVSGDVFDAADVSYATRRVFTDGLVRLEEAGIRAYLCAGNHDPLSGWGLLEGMLPSNTQMFGSGGIERVEHRRDGELVAVLYGTSYQDGVEPRRLAREYRRRPEDPIAIGVLHTDVGGDPSYAPSSLSELASAGMDYWALGHIHRAGVVAERPPALYAGSPQGLNINENSDHGCYVVDIEAPGAPASYGFVRTAHVAWERVEVDVSSVSTEDEVYERMVSVAGDLVSRHGGPVCARVVLVGAGGAHERLRRRNTVDDLRLRVNRRLGAQGSWFRIDSLIDRTTPAVDETAIEVAGLFPSMVLAAADPLSSDGSFLEALGDDVYRVAGIDPELDAEELLRLATATVFDALGGDL